MIQLKKWRVHFQSILLDCTTCSEFLHCASLVLNDMMNRNIDLSKGIEEYLKLG